MLRYMEVKGVAEEEETRPRHSLFGMKQQMQILGRLERQWMMGF